MQPSRSTELRGVDRHGSKSSRLAPATPTLDSGLAGVNGIISSQSTLDFTKTQSAVEKRSSVLRNTNLQKFRRHGAGHTHADAPPSSKDSSRYSCAQRRARRYLQKAMC